MTAPQAQIIALLKEWVEQRKMLAHRIDDAEFQALMAQFEAANEAAVPKMSAFSRLLSRNGNERQRRR
jgi:hypothetical protein